MNDLIKYHDNDQVIEHNVVSFESQSEPHSEGASSLIQGILRRWPIVLLIFIFICAIGLPTIWYLVEPLYTVMGAIRVAPVIQDIITGKDETGGIPNYQTYMNTQADIITSTTIVERVADELADNNLSFFTEGSTNPLRKIKQKISKATVSPDPGIVLKQAINDKVITVIPPTAPNRTEFMKITMKARNPEEASLIVDAFITAYVNFEKNNLTQSRDGNLTTLRKEQAFWKDKMDKARVDIRQKSQEYGGPNPAEQKQHLMQSQRIPMLLAELTRLESRKIALKTQVDLLLEFPEQSIEPKEMLRIKNEYINSNPSVQQLTQTVIQYERELIIAQQNLSVENPTIRQTQELIDTFKLKLKEKREEIAEEFDSMASKEATNASVIKLHAAKAELQQTIKHEEQVRKQLEDADIELLKVSRTQLDIDDLQLEYERAKEMYDTLTRRITDLEMEQKRSQRIEPYYADIGPKLDERMKYSMALIFGALGCGIFFAFLVNKADTRLQTPEDVSKQIGLRIIGTTTSSHNIKPYLLPEQIAGDYQTIRTNLGLINDEGIPRRLVVTSPGMREGKTTFSVNLATSLSRSGKKVLLIDGDLRKPDVANMLGIPGGSGHGLQDVLLGEEFDNAVYTIPSTGLDVLIADSQSRLNGYELLASPGTRQCIDMLSQQYDHVIIDSTPILAFPDALIWATLGDAVILVSYAGHTTTPDLKEATERLTRINVKVLGTVLSNVSSEYSYFRSDLNRYIHIAKTKGSAKRGKKKPIVNMQSIEENPDNSTTAEFNQQVED